MKTQYIIDPSGKVLWKGGFFYVGGGYSRFGYLYSRFQLYQQGGCGNPWKVEINARSWTAGFGLPIAISGGQGLSFYDPDPSCPANPYAFNGDFSAYWASYVVGAGYGWVKKRLGRLNSGWVKGWTGGIDVSAGATFWGRSSVSSVQ